MREIFIPSEFGDIIGLLSSNEYKNFVEQKNKEIKSVVRQLADVDVSKAIDVAQSVRILGEPQSIEEFIESFNREKKSKKLIADGNEVIILTESMFDAMIFGKPVCIGGVWIAMSDKSEVAIADKIEQKRDKEWGLNGSQEEK